MAGRASPVYVHLTKGEKDALLGLCAKTNRSASSCIRDIIGPYIVDYFPVEERSVKISEVDLTEPLYDDGVVGLESSRKKNVVRIYLSDSELAYLKRNARRVRLSAYIRKIIFAGPSRFQIAVATEDVNELRDRIESSVGYMSELLARIDWKNYITHSDVKNLLKLSEDIQREVKFMLNEVEQNRQSIRRRGKKILEKRLSELLKDAELDTENQNSNSKNGN